MGQFKLNTVVTRIWNENENFKEQLLVDKLLYLGYFNIV